MATWFSDLVDGQFRQWEQRRLAKEKKDRILIRVFEKKYPCALFLDKPIGNGEYIAHCITGSRSPLTIQRFLEQHDPVGEKNAVAVNTLLEELARIGYNVVVVEQDEIPPSGPEN